MVGYSLAFGDDLGCGLIGDPRQYAGLGQLLEPGANGDSTVPLLLFVVFQGLFSVSPESRDPRSATVDRKPAR